MRKASGVQAVLWGSLRFLGFRAWAFHGLMRAKPYKEGGPPTYQKTYKEPKLSYKDPD